MTTIRPARSEDVADIFRIRLAVRENALSLDELAALGITPSSVTALITEAPGTAWVAGDIAGLTGFAIIDQEEASLFAAFVLPEAEGRGIGRALVAAAEAALFARHTEISLETAQGSRAEGFYRHLGWGRAEDMGGGDIRLWKSRP